MRYGQRQANGYSTFAAAGNPRKGYWNNSEVPVAEVNLTEGGIKPLLKQENFYGSTDYHWANGGQDEAYPKQWSHRGQPEQGRMFEEKPSKISSAFADPSMKAAVPTLLGLAINRSKQLGGGLMADSSLSKQSSPLAKRGLKAGLLVPNPSNPSGKKTNNIGWMPRTWDIGPHATLDEAISSGHLNTEMTEVPTEQIAAAKSTVRGLLRSKKSAVTPPNEQQVLRTMAPKERRLHTWLNANSAAPDDAPNTAGHDQPLDLGHRYNPVSQANQQAWYQKHYSDPEPPVGTAERIRLESEIDSEYHLPHVTQHGGTVDLEPMRGSGPLNNAEVKQRKKRLADADFVDPRSPSMAEWQDSAPKPGKGQKRLF